MLRRFLVFTEMRVDGADVDMGACRADPVFYFVHFKLEGFFEIGEGDLRFVLSG